ncbi:MAG TPA: hypothetical protein VI564_09220 [Candidatus Nanoarchaeia archaeon]|nr:hypothetical protein [Candidatus Nanoarchaeia archaeon]
MSLEDKVNDKESKGFVKKALTIGWKLGMAAATTALSLSLVGTTGVMVGAALAGGGAIGNLWRGKSLYESMSVALTTYSAVNAIISPIISLGNATIPLIDGSNFLGIAARTLYATTAYNAAFIASFRGASHLVDNYMNPIGITKTIGNNFYNEFKRIGLGFFPGYLVGSALNIPSIMGIPTFAWNAFPLGLYNSLYPVPASKPSGHSSYNPAPAMAGAAAH